MLAAAGHLLFVCKPQSHPTLSECPASNATPLVETVKRGKQRFRYTYLWMCDLPLRDDAGASRVDLLSIEIADPNGKVTYRNSFVTDLPFDRANVVEMAACSRARSKVENKPSLQSRAQFPPRHLAAVLVILNFLACACHTAPSSPITHGRKAEAADQPERRESF